VFQNPIPQSSSRQEFQLIEECRLILIHNDKSMFFQFASGENLAQMQPLQVDPYRQENQRNSRCPELQLTEECKWKSINSHESTLSQFVSAETLIQT
jgi:hypothetical protein